MSINEIQNEVNTLVKSSGMAPSMNMCCSITRIIRMRHTNVDLKFTNAIVKTVIKDLL